MKLRDYLTEGLDTKRIMKDAWGDAQMKLVFKWGKANGAWVILAIHPSTKKYYGINYVDEMIEGVTKQKAIAWAEDFAGVNVNI